MQMFVNIALLSFEKVQNICNNFLGFPSSLALEH